MLYETHKISSLNSKLQLLKAGILYITVNDDDDDDNNNNNQYCIVRVIK